MIRSLMITVFCIACLCACVTTTNRRPIDVDSAHDKRIELGMKYLGVDKRDNARYQFSKALELKKNSAQAYHGFALVHQANGEFDPAEDSFKKSMRLASEKDQSPIFVSYGKFLMEEGRPSEACEYFHKAANDYDFSERPKALVLEAKCAKATGNTARVKPAFEHALNLNEFYAPALIELADIYFVETKYAQAKKLLDRYLTVAPPSARALWLGIRIERIFGNKDKEASYALSLKNRFPYSNELLNYRKLVDAEK